MKLPTTLAAVLFVTSALVAQKVDFVKDIKPILEKRCYECHAGEEEEGDLQFDRRSSVFAERDDAIITPGKPDRSMMYLRITLPADDADIMPPDGGPLTKAQIATIKKWIEEGADWPKSADAPPAKKLKPEILRVPELDADAKKAQAAAVAALAKRGVTALPISNGSNALYVNLSLLGKKIKDADLALLDGLEPSLVWLNLGRTAITDAGAAKLARFKELRRLHLRETGIGDGALEAVAKLGKLEYLNLFDTKVTDAGLGHLEGVKGLRKLYLWKTKTTEAGAKRLAKAVPELAIDRGEYIKTLRAVAAKIKARQPVNDVCPIMNKKANPQKTYRFKNETFAFCCDKCVAKFAKDPLKFVAKVQRKGEAKKGAKKGPGKKGPGKKRPGRKRANRRRKAPVNDVCPVAGRPAKPRFSHVYKGERIALCCGNCLAKFKKEPAKYIGKLVRKQK